MSRPDAEHRTIECRDGGRIVVVADSHSRPHPSAHELIRGLEPAAILHAGDIGDAHVIDDLAEIAPVHWVRGNIDGHDAGPEELLLDITNAGRRRLRLFLTHIAVRGPRLMAPVRRNAEHHQANLVVCGHSHVPFIGTDRGMTVFNPGSLGPRRFTLPIVFGVMELSETLRLSHLSCETGEAWAP